MQNGVCFYPFFDGSFITCITGCKGPTVAPLMLLAQIITPLHCGFLILLWGAVPFSSHPLIQPSGPSRVVCDSSVNKTCSKFVFI